MSSPLVSVIVPVYNTEKYLRECLDSILEQTYKNIEVLVTDDGSKDDSYKIMESYARKDIRVHIFRQENQGPNAARLNGLKHAKGEYVTFVDADDFIDENLISDQLRVIIKNKVDLAMSTVKTIELDGNYSHPKDFLEGRFQGRELAEQMIDIEHFFKMNVRISFCSHLMKKKLILNIMDTFDQRIKLSEDVACMILACMDSDYVYCSNTEQYVARMHVDSLMHKHKTGYLDAMKYLYKFMQIELTKRNASEKIQRELEILIIRNLLIEGYEEAFGDSEDLYPFNNINKNSKVAVYGAGAFGLELIRVLKNSKYFNLTKWVDRSWEKLDQTEFPIESPQKLVDDDSDFIIIANTKYNQIREIKNNLIKMGISEAKIKSIDVSKINYRFCPRLIDN